MINIANRHSFHLYDVKEKRLDYFNVFLTKIQYKKNLIKKITNTKKSET